VTKYRQISAEEAPGGVPAELALKRGDTIIVLDDYSLMRYVWSSKFEDYKTEIDLQFFTKGQETIDFVKAFAEKDRLFLLCDYELKQRDMNGIDVISLSDMKDRSIIVSGIYSDPLMQKKALLLGIEILAKRDIENIKISLEK
jgi:CheY-like chemotaxis protein